jgi:DNA-binding SARP family transcriptional activator
MSKLQLSLLGEPLMKHGEETLTFSTRKALALLVYLAVEGGKHTRKTLSEAFWPELDAEHGRAALRATLFELRKVLEHGQEPDEMGHLDIGRDTLGIAQDSSLVLDLRLVEAVSKRIGRQGAPLEGEREGELLAQLEEALSLVRGSFLAGFTLRDAQFFDDWTRQHREYWHLRVHQLFDALSRLYERAGNVEQAIDAVRRWLSFDPLHEAGYRSLMRLRFSLGDRAGALRAYTTCCEVLAQELDMEPEPETVALAKRIRRTTPLRRTRTQPLDPSPELSSTHLLDSAFLGRAAEFGMLIDCYQRVEAGQPQLVLLEGESGMGKTRLSSEFLGWAQAQGADVLAGKALQTSRQLLYQPFIDMLRQRLQQEHAPGDFVSDIWLAELARLLPELRDRSSDLPVPTGDEALGHCRLLEATARLLQVWAARCPLVLFIDDMQWSDTASLDMLLYLAQSLAAQPTPILLLLSLRPGAETFSDSQSTWVMALKRTGIPLTSLVLTAFTHEETQRFVQALSWVQSPAEAEHNGASGGGFAEGSSAAFRERVASFAHWLYAQAHGHPFYLLEMLKGLLEREIIVPALQQQGTWGLVLRHELLAQTPTSALIPSSVRELLRAQLGLLTPAAWSLLVAGAAMGEGLTFERLCQVAQLDEETGVQALEEALRGGWLCEDTTAEASQTQEGYRFAGEMIRAVVYQEAGAARQHLMQRRVAAVLRAEAEDDQDEEVHFPHPTSLEGHVPAETRKRQGRRGVNGAASWGIRGMPLGVATGASGPRGDLHMRVHARKPGWRRGSERQRRKRLSPFPHDPLQAVPLERIIMFEAGVRAVTRKGGN